MNKRGLRLKLVALSLMALGALCADRGGSFFVFVGCLTYVFGIARREGWIVGFMLGALSAQAAFYNNYDATAQNWRRDVVVQGSSVTNSSYVAATRFMLNMRQSGAYKYVQRCGVYLTTTTNGLVVPLINKIAVALDGTVGLSYSEAVGASVGAGTQNGLNTFYVPATHASGINDFHMGVYCRTPSNLAHTTMRAAASGDASRDLSLLVAYSGTTHFSCTSQSAYTSVSDSNGVGFYLGTRRSASAQVLLKNGVPIGTNSAPAGSFPVGVSIAVHVGNVSGVLIDGDPRALTFYTIGLLLPDAIALSYYRVVQRLQIDKQRNV